MRSSLMAESNFLRDKVSRQDSTNKKKSDGHRHNSLSRAVLPDRNCDIFLVTQADPEVCFSSLESPHRARRHLVYPTASNWPEFSATARKKIKNIKSLCKSSYISCSWSKLPSLSCKILLLNFPLHIIS